LIAITSAVPAVRVSGHPAVGHPVPAFALAADQASDLVGRPGFAGFLGLDCSCVSSMVGVYATSQSPAAHAGSVLGGIIGADPVSGFGPQIANGGGSESNSGKKGCRACWRPRLFGLHDQHDTTRRYMNEVAFYGGGTACYD